MSESDAPDVIIRGPWTGEVPEFAPVRLFVDRIVLSKRRWRASAENGHDFGFILERPLKDADLFHVEDGIGYFIAQLPEPVLEVALTHPSVAARIGWSIGNLHFPVQILPEMILAPADLAVRQLLEREGVAFREASLVFRPERAGAHEPHSHSHSHGHVH